MGLFYIAKICQEFKWDYYTFKQQPVLFIEYIRTMLEGDNIIEQEKADEQQRKAKIK